MGSGKSSFSELPTAHLQLCISVQSSALILSWRVTVWLKGFWRAVPRISWAPYDYLNFISTALYKIFSFVKAFHEYGGLVSSSVIRLHVTTAVSHHQNVTQITLLVKMAPFNTTIKEILFWADLGLSTGKVKTLGCAVILTFGWYDIPLGRSRDW